MPTALRALRGSWRWMALGVLGLAYAVLAHHTNTTPDRGAMGTALAIAPLAGAVLALAWNSARRSTMLLACGLGFGAFWLGWSRLPLHFSLLYWIEHAGTELLLCLAFARTLAPGREPMCTVFARMIHGTLTPPIERYTRQLTRAWAVFFGAMATISTVLYHAGPLPAWSLFANFVTGPLILLMFVAEYALRRRLLPDTRHVPMMAAIKAYWDAPAR